MKKEEEDKPEEISQNFWKNINEAPTLKYAIISNPTQLTMLIFITRKYLPPVQINTNF